MKSEKEYIPGALREVWQWRESICREVANLAPRDAIHVILEKAKIVSTPKAGAFAPSVSAPPPAVAETSPRYTAGK